MEETEKPVSQRSALELQNIFWGKSCKYSFKSSSLRRLIVTLVLFIQSYNPSLATTKVSSGGNKAGHAQDGLRRYLLSSPRMVMSDVDLWLGKYLNSEIIRCSESYNDNTSRYTVVSQNQLTTAWGFARALGHVSSSSMASWGLIPTNASSHQSNLQPAAWQWALLSKGIPSVISPFLVHHPNPSSVNTLDDYFWDRVPGIE